ncbi:MAG: S-layer homology domain-containing protein [Desulfotomaculaceae bacterium]|nr:S-layer homology domain-containing protein [Desulfotomaculaceae bacterium]
MAQRKIAIVVCLLIGLVLFFTGTALAAMPSDIQGHWAEQQIKDGINQGLIEGYPDGSFKPDNYITRAEFITLVNRYYGFNEMEQINFSDVSQIDWFYEEIARAAKAGFISGYPDGSMKPNNFITREEAAAILYVLHNLKAPENLDAIEKFDDAHLIPAWSKEYLAALVANCLMYGYPDNTIRPARFISRAETIVILLRDICETPIIPTPGGGGGGGGDKTPPRLIAATITLNETVINKVYEYDFEINKNVGKNDYVCSIDFSDKDPYSWITAGTITVSEKPVTLALENVTDNSYFRGLTLSQEIDSLTASMTVFDYLNAGDPGGSVGDNNEEGVSLWFLRQIFNNDEAVLSGSLTDPRGNSSNVSLIVKLPE